MYAVNLGTRGVLEALDVLEYANIRSGTTLSDARIKNGRVEPYRIKMWCLGNEMDGPWQLGHRNAEDYGKLASQTAKAMRQIDPDLELVVCGSSKRSDADLRRVGAHRPAAHLRGRRLHLLHAYYEERDGDAGSFLAAATNMDHFIESVVATADTVRAQLGQTKRINLSFDEWNVWYITRYHERRQDHRHRAVADRPPAAGGQLLGARRRRRRQPADLAAQARRPGDLGVTRPSWST